MFIGRVERNLVGNRLGLSYFQAMITLGTIVMGGSLMADLMTMNARTNAGQKLTMDRMQIMQSISAVLEHQGSCDLSGLGAGTNWTPSVKKSINALSLPNGEELVRSGVDPRTGLDFSIQVRRVGTVFPATGGCVDNDPAGVPNCVYMASLDLVARNTKEGIVIGSPVVQESFNYFVVTAPANGDAVQRPVWSCYRQSLTASLVGGAPQGGWSPGNGNPFDSGDPGDSDSGGNLDQGPGDPGTPGGDTGGGYSGGGGGKTGGGSGPGGPLTGGPGGSGPGGGPSPGCNGGLSCSPVD